MEQNGVNFKIINMRTRNVLAPVLFLVSGLGASAQTVMGDDNASVNGTAVDNSAELKVMSSTNNQGVLIPTLTSTQMNGIVNPATGLLVYNTTQGEFLYYNGSAWASFQKIETVTTNSKVGMYQGETKLYKYATGNYLMFLNGSNNWRKINIGAGSLP